MSRLQARRDLSVVMLVLSSAQDARSIEACRIDWKELGHIETQTTYPLLVNGPVGVIDRSGNEYLFGSSVIEIQRDLENINRREVKDTDQLRGVLLGGGGRVSPLAGLDHPVIRQKLFAVPRTGGGAHVVWGVRPDSRGGYDFSVKEIWTADFDGTRWSVPKVLASESEINWGDGVSVVETHNGRIQIAAPAMDSGRPGILLLVGEGRTWQRTFVATGTAFPPSGLAIDGSSREHLDVYFHEKRFDLIPETTKIVGFRYAYRDRRWSRLKTDLALGTPMSAVINWPRTVYLSGSPSFFWAAHNANGKVATVRRLSLAMPESTPRDSVVLSDEIGSLQIFSLSRTHALMVFQRGDGERPEYVLWGPKTTHQAVTYIPGPKVVVGSFALAMHKNNTFTLTWTSVHAVTVRGQRLEMPASTRMLGRLRC